MPSRGTLEHLCGKMRRFTGVWDGSPSKVGPFLHQCLSYDITAVENHHGCRKRPERFLSLMTSRGKLSILNIQFCVITCVSTFQAVDVPVPLGQVGQMYRQVVLHQLRHVADEEATGRTWDGRRRGAAKETAERRQQAAFYSRKWQRKEKHISLRPVEGFPIVSRDSLSLGSFLTHVSFSTINSSTSTSAAPTPATNTSADIFCLLANVLSQKAAPHPACLIYSPLMSFVDCWCFD